MIFDTFQSTDIVAGRIQSVSTGMFSDGLPSWPVSTDTSSGFFTSSQQTILSQSQFEPLNGLYYTDVYDYPTSSINADVYFSLAYGHYAGSGSSVFDTDTTQGSLLFPTKAIYDQYRNLLLTPGTPLFSFTSTQAGNIGGVVFSNDIYVINFRGSKVKDQLDPGQFQITLVGDSSSSVTLIDDSQLNPNTSVQTGGEYYNLIVGTLAAGPSATYQYQGIGSLYPSLGLVILNPTFLATTLGTINGISFTNPDPSNWGAGSQVFAQMQNLLYQSIVQGCTTSSQMQARVTEYVPAQHFFVRIKNQEFNYSNNPTFVISSEDNPVNATDIGKIRFSDFYTNPKVYVTTVGLYDAGNNLVAVAKLSQPTLKDFTNELLVRVRLDY
jgi:hypothetical protein